MNDELKQELEELKQDKTVFSEYIKAFYNIEKVQDNYKNTDEFKIIEKFIKNENDN